MEEDIREVLKEETGTDIFLKEEEDSVYKGYKLEVNFFTWYFQNGGNSGIRIIIALFPQILLTEPFCKESQEVISSGPLGKRRAGCPAFHRRHCFGCTGE